ncbi:MAG: stage III sporulation protein AB [Clostridiaceae bacterium]|nr:stage III sporulation protein AB [Clostridiaceae bacterium]
MPDPTRFASAAAYLPEAIRRSALTLPEDIRLCGEELRLRFGYTPTVTVDGMEKSFHTAAVSDSDLARTLELATRSSVHTAMDSLREGFVTVPDGHRIGVCGIAAVSDHGLLSLRRVTSVSIRIAREFRGIAEPVYTALMRTGGVDGTLIVSPPGLGKTTLLRDLVRLASDHGTRVSLIDERSELAAGAFDVGAHTDVMTGVPKARAIPMLLRAMSPQLLAVDEITAHADVDAMEQAVGCGVGLLATVHGTALADITARPALDGFLRRGAFRNVVFIDRAGKGRRYRTEGIR